MTPALGLAGEIEPVAARGWPPAVEEALGAWRLTASSGWSGRINSCWAMGDPGASLSDAVSKVEGWYRARSLPPCFRIIEGAAPNLVGLIEGRGYAATAETLVMVGPVEGREDAAVVMSSDMDQDFSTVFATANGEHAAESAERLAALGRIQPPRFFAVAGNAEPSAIGACAVEPPWAGIFAMRTLPEHRRKGLARAVLGALLASARSSGALRAYLQVEVANTAAINLYGTAGFREAYRYRYWSPRGSR